MTAMSVFSSQTCVHVKAFKQNRTIAFVQTKSLSTVNDRKLQQVICTASFIDTFSNIIIGISIESWATNSSLLASIWVCH